MLRARIRIVLVAVVLPWVAGCDTIGEVLAIFGPGTPPPKEVWDALPTPSDAVIDDAGCVGVSHTKGFTCVVHAESGVAMEPGAAAAARAMAGWKEYSWDWVPGRIQSSWTRAKENVSIAVHENGSRSRWSLTYTWGEFADPLANKPYSKVPRQADARVPETLASLPIPKNATLLQAMAQPGRPQAEAIFSVDGDPEAILAPFQSMDGWEKTLRARAPWAVSAANKRDATEVAATVWIGEQGKHTLVVASHPAQ